MKKSSLLCATILAVASSARAIEFSRIDLVTDDQSANAAVISDSGAKNSWGISFAGTSPFWVSANGSGVSNLYSVNPTSGTVAKVGLIVTIPGDGSVTGQLSNSNSAAFNGDRFLFVSEDGTISGWRNALGTTAEVLAVASTANVYKGTAAATISGSTYLYAANFRAGTIDVLKGTAGAPDLAGNFIDPSIPAGFAPFNIQNLGGTLYVTYAQQDATKHDDVAGAGLGFVDAFNTQGTLLTRVGTQGNLNSPWGLAIAPSSFGPFAGDLLVGNFGDGRINAYNLGTNSFVDQLSGVGGQPLSIDGLWGLTIGNDGSAGSSQRIYFSAGPNGEANGLFGVIAPVPEPSTIVLLSAGAFGLLAYGWRRRAKQNSI
jgi:uncharacterized protein (TIGR03118 family)